MFKVFIEYKIAAEGLHDYLHFMEMRGDVASFGLYEGTDQPGLFVEIWDHLDRNAYLELKRERTSEPDSLWREMDGWIEGGPGKIHIWHFQKVK